MLPFNVRNRNHQLQAYLLGLFKQIVEFESWIQVERKDWVWKLKVDKTNSVHLG
jgi:hypothetical protein